MSHGKRSTRQFVSFPMFRMFMTCTFGPLHMDSPHSASTVNPMIPWPCTTFGMPVANSEFRMPPFKYNPYRGRRVSRVGIFPHALGILMIIEFEIQHPLEQGRFQTLNHPAAVDYRRKFKRKQGYSATFGLTKSCHSEGLQDFLMPPFGSRSPFLRQNVQLIVP